jgi:hypothetical protein
MRTSLTSWALLKMLTVDGVGCDDTGVGGVMDGGVDAVGVITIDMKVGQWWKASHVLNVTPKLVKLFLLSDTSPFVTNWIANFITIMHIVNKGIDETYLPFLRRNAAGLGLVGSLGSRWVSPSTCASSRERISLIYLIPSYLRDLVTFLLTRTLSAMWVKAAFQVALVGVVGVGREVGMIW